VGWFLGYQVTPRPERAQLDLLASEVREMKKTIMLSKLENPSAGERMQAIQSAQDLSGPDEAVIVALVQTMNGDPNVNVRLVAVEALARFAGRPKVREALIQSIVRQESPLIQLALAEVMLALHEKRAVEPFRKVMADPQLDYWVKSKLEDTVRQLL
jgi:HEAT repeat protein